MENEKISSNCTFSLVPKRNSKIFCQVPSQVKGHDVKLNFKNNKSFCPWSLKLLKILGKLMVIKVSEHLYSVRMTSMKWHVIEALSILSYTNYSSTQTRKNDTMYYLSCDYKQLRSGVPKSSEYLQLDSNPQPLSS